jgi:C1A family cysteine protease
MNSRLRFTIFAALVLTVTLTQLPSTVTSQQSKPQSIQKTPDQNQPSPEAQEKLRKLAAKQKTYQVGYNPAMERKLTQLSGIEIPRGTVRQALKVRQEAQQKLAESIRRREEYLKANPDKVFDSIDVYKILRRDLQNAHPGQQIPNEPQGLVGLLPTFNWFEQNVFAPVKDQGSCNSCWAFAALAAYEYSHNIQQSRIRGSSGGFNQTLRNGEIIPGLSMVSAAML